MRDKENPVKVKHLVILAATGAAAAWVLTHTEASDWRYPRLLLTNLPKMPFRYFV